MIFNVPQFIDIEDRIVGPLTAKQLGWLAAGAAVSFLAWVFLDYATFIIATIGIFLIFGLLAFVKPNGKPLISFLGSICIFAFRSKKYIWKRETSKKDTAKQAKIINENKQTYSNKVVGLEEINQVAQLLEIKKK